MMAIAVTGASGAVGERTVRQLASHSEVTRIVAIDQRQTSFPFPTVSQVHLDLLATDESAGSDLAAHLAGVSSLIHLAEHGSRRDDAHVAATILRRTLDAASAVNCDHVVILSSATVYGAWPDNPIPLTEAEPARPNPELAFAVSKLALEEIGRGWEAEQPGRAVAVLRPTTTLSERGVSWVAKSIRAATSVRPDQADPPTQFLHHDDLASALSFVSRNRMTGIFNVAPDGWIGAEAFHDLVGRPELRVSQAVNDRLLRAGRWLGVRSTPPGIEAYVRQPWVIGNDRLRSAGWTPAFSNEEAYVLGTPPPPWSVSAQRRQELALGAVGVAVAAAAAAATGLARRLTK